FSTKMASFSFRNAARKKSLELVSGRIPFVAMSGLVKAMKHAPYADFAKNLELLLLRFSRFISLSTTPVVTISLASGKSTPFLWETTTDLSSQIQTRSRSMNGKTHRCCQKSSPKTKEHPPTSLHKNMRLGSIFCAKKHQYPHFFNNYGNSSRKCITSCSSFYFARRRASSLWRDVRCSSSLWSSTRDAARN